jgi:copper resistance protein D
MESLVVICRFVHFAAVFILFGSIAFGTLIAAGQVRELLAPRLAAWQRTAIWVAALSAVLWLILAVAEAGDGLASATDRAMIGSFLTGTNFGRVWMLRLALLGALLAITISGTKTSDRVMLVLSAILVGELGWIGHPAAHDGLMGILHCSNYAVHAIAAALWVGALPALALSLALAKGEDMRGDIAATVAHFSRTGYLAVSLVLITGVIGTWVMLGSWPSWSASPYQFWLTLKLAVVAVMLGLAATNRFVFTPALRSRPDPSRAALWRMTLGEVVLGFTILALVAHFGALPPMGE